jgi:hypothetical protein
MGGPYAITNPLSTKDAIRIPVKVPRTGAGGELHKIVDLYWTTSAGDLVGDHMA